MNNDLISRDYVSNKICDLYSDGEKANKKDRIINEVMDIIDNAPTVEPEKAKESELIKAYTKGFDTGVETVKNERPQGEWIKNEHTFWTCSHCNWFNEMNRIKYNFCPCCGADMQKGGAE